MKTIGVLALQGSVVEHINSLQKIEGILPMEVKSRKDIDKIDSIIMPGGESTTIGKLLRDFELLEPLSDRINKGMPVWGTCAGMILLAGKIIGEDHVHLGLMDIEVRRNAYGGQLDSFSCHACIDKVSKAPVNLIFIRAPWIERVNGNVEVLAEYEGKIIAARQGNMLVTSFHPELTEDLSFHKYFSEF
ncbi:MAG: pyridoxal 5'-phosphate synthase glutaminase subunit PdxT [Bacillota bacterium]|nr:pyridoxal 5'-phosphate synthase glutaminase subunit PdxT [Bacillota bacterium]